MERANATLNGKRFEEATNHFTRLIDMGFEKHSYIKNPKKEPHYYLEKTYDDKKIVYTSQHGFKVFMKNQYNIDLYRCPDEAYIIEMNGKKIVKIVEKKEQRVDGSVETKLWAAIGLKEEYAIELADFEIHYGFCLNDYFKKKLNSNERKYVTLNKIFKKYDIHVLFGEDEDYYSTLKDWIHL